MSAVAIADARTVSAVPGRLRVHLDAWSGAGPRGLEARIRSWSGVRGAQANALTRNVLIRYDAEQTNEHALMHAVTSFDANQFMDREGSTVPLALVQREGNVQRARITVRGLDRDPGLVRDVIELLKRQAGVVHVSASPLTGRVMVEFHQHEISLDDVLDHVAQIELPPLPGEDRPAHPLDRGPLLQSATRTTGAALGLTLLAGRQLGGLTVSPNLQSAGIRASATLSIVQGMGFVRHGLRRFLGKDLADLLFYVPTIISLTLAGSPLGLAVTGAEALRLLTEIIPRRRAWRAYEARLSGVGAAEPGVMIRVESGERTPLPACVVEGLGTAVGASGLPEAVAPEGHVGAGARLFGGPFVLRLEGGPAFTPHPRTTPVSPGIYQHYIKRLGRLSWAYAALTAVVTRSVGRTFTALLLVSPRTAVIGTEAADTGASARVLRAGVTVVGTRPERAIRLPSALILGSPRVLTDGYEISSVVPLHASDDVEIITERITALGAATGSPWGTALASTSSGTRMTDGAFDGASARATIDERQFRLGPVVDENIVPADLRMRFRGQHVLALHDESGGRAMALVVLRPKLAPGVEELTATCRRHGVAIELVSSDQSLGAQVLAHRAGIDISDEDSAESAIRTRQNLGEIVAFVSDSAAAAPAFSACDLGIGLSSGRTSRFPARADMLAPDLVALAAIVEAGARRDIAVRDSVGLSIAANVFGAFWGLRSGPGIQRASYGVYATALATLADGWFRLRGGQRSWSSVARLIDPRPEQWGRRDIAGVLRSLRASEWGLTSEEAEQRMRHAPGTVSRSRFLQTVLTQVRSPLTAVLAAGAGLSVVLGSTGDVVMIGLTIVANVLVAAWQERQAGQAVAALQRIGSTTARVLRDGNVVEVPTDAIVPGDVLVLGHGDRIAADARVLFAQNLETDEAALTGESLPVAKVASGGSDSSHIVLAGSDVTVGSGRAVVVAVGSRTRMGAMAAALDIDETQHSPLGVRLNQMLRQILPLAGVGGLVVFASGVVRGQALLPQLAIAASIAIASVPEGLPLLAGVGEAAVARRLAPRGALVRRLAAVEALGRVDVACTDKTGTLTEGRLSLQVVATPDGQANLGKSISDDMKALLLTAALATPHPDAADARAHPTDIAVFEGAERAGLGDEIRAQRDREAPFDPSRPFHATVASDKLYVKGAAEELVRRCTQVHRDGRDRRLQGPGREALLAQAHELAGQGLRVLMVAKGQVGGDPADPQRLTALGFIGIRDPLRAGVREAVERCREAGVRVVMLTGDHPATAAAIAQQAGLMHAGVDVLTGEEIAGLEDGALDERLERASVIARVTPLDKLRIVESLQRHGHTVAMTGDGVNDGPALRLADVGVAMGIGGTEVARQAADVVLADDDFATLVEALVEGRSFWKNIRRAVALLLGGNLGELGLMVGGSALGVTAPLITRQILAVNLITDALPALAVALQPPEHRHLAGLAREGTAALDAPLRNEVLRRGFATAAPSLVAFLLSARSHGVAEARSVAFASVVATQLVQTLDVGRSEGTLTRSVLGAVGASFGVLGAALTVPPLRAFLSLALPSPFGLLLVGTASFAALLLGRVAPALAGLRPPSIPSRPGLALLGARYQSPRLLPAP